MSSPRVFLHVGSPKTGTTFLQAVLWRGKEIAREQGLLLPLGSLHAHFDGAMDIRGRTERARSEGGWQRLLNRIGTWEGDALVSHEHFAPASADQAQRAIESLIELDREVHIVLTARDLARQIAAEWQERIKHRSTASFADFMERIQTPESSTFESMWLVQDYADILRRWSSTLAPSQRHVVTVPPAGGPPDVLWRRFAGLLGLDPGAFDLDVPRANPSLGYQQAELLRRVNVTLGERLPFPGPYSANVKGFLAHNILEGRSGDRLVLGGEDLEFARERSVQLVEELTELEVDVVGDLAELLVPDRVDAPPVSTARVPIPEEDLLRESIEVTAELLDRLRMRQERQSADMQELRLKLKSARAESEKQGRAVRSARDEAARAAGERDALVERGVRRRASLLVRRAREAAGLGEGRRPKIHFLMYNVDGIGGVARTTINIANALADHYEVEVLSLFRARGHTTFPLDPRVKVRYLIHANPHRLDYPAADAPLAAKPSALDAGDPTFTELSDRRMRAALRRIRKGDVVISLRPSLHLALATFGKSDTVRIAWDHFNYPSRYRESGDGPAGRLVDAAMPALDAYVVLTEADAADYRRRHPDAHIRVIRNSMGWKPRQRRPRRDGKIVVGAGRLTGVKGFERLIAAWALLAEEFPDWTLQIYGKGPDRPALVRQIEELGLTNVELPGYTDDMPGTLATAAIFAMSSRKEGFPMTLIEALSQGTPLVSFDCPRGPGEIIVDGENGRLVPDGDVPGLAKALGELMRDRELRDRMGEQALRDSWQYDLPHITADWQRLIRDLTGHP